MQSIMLALLTLKARFDEQKERGATVVEYALVIGGISLLLITGASFLTGAMQGFWTSLGAQLSGYFTD